jgi:hypothetical protein
MEVENTDKRRYGNIIKGSYPCPKHKMKKTTPDEWTLRPETSKVLLWFLSPRTPRKVEKLLGIRKLKMKPFVEKGLLKPLNPLARKGKFFVATAKARRSLGLPALKRGIDKDWDLIGWIKASPRQRLVVLKATDSAKRLSEEIRERASRSNRHLTRISVKAILKELVGQGLIESKLTQRKRRYRITHRGRSILDALDRIFGGGKLGDRLRNHSI